MLCNFLTTKLTISQYYVSRTHSTHLPTITEALLADTENWFCTNFGPNVANPLRIRPA